MTKKELTRLRIIEVALIEFGTKGYDLASTNNIYKAADVSKGTIFLYFKSKAELYYQVFAHYLNNIVAKLDEINFDHYEDVFEKMMHVTFWKYQYFSSRPYESNLLIEAVTKPPSEIAAKVMTHMEELTKLSINNFLNDIDMNRFSQEYTKEEVARYIQFALSGLQNTVLKQNISLEYLESIQDDSMKFLKTVLKGMEK